MPRPAKVKNSHSIKKIRPVTVVAALMDRTDDADAIVPFADTEPEVIDAGRTAEPEILQCPDAARGCCH